MTLTLTDHLVIAMVDSTDTTTNPLIPTLERAVTAWLFSAQEKIARHLALLEDDEDWPTNEALGGSLTGTRDDEYRSGMRDQARELIELILEDD